MKEKRILWADDEIELLQPHILFLQSKGYRIDTVTNGDDAISKSREIYYDIVLLDEMMTGKDGLTTLNEIKTIHPQLPVIMITKSEEESLMEDAIGHKIDDYLTKPVNPSQILSACKKLLDKKNITVERKSRQYPAEINRISSILMNPLDYQQWIDLYLKIVQWDVEFDEIEETQFRDILYDQRKECNVEFGKFLEKNYSNWVWGKSSSPVLSPDLVKKYIVPELKNGKKIIFMVIDCLRLDQWSILEQNFYQYFNIKKEYYYSILPTATPFSRNSIFSGLFPDDIEKKHPELWNSGTDDEGSLNKYEDILLEQNLKRNGVSLSKDLKYVKIMNNEDARAFMRNIDNHLDTQFLTVVLNFVDILAHSRSDLPILKEIAPDESAYRSLTKSWFEHSVIFDAIKRFSKEDVILFISTDHGSVRGMRGTKVIGDRETSTNLRYKFGRSLKVDQKNAIYVKDPREFRLPKINLNTTFIIAKEDYYFIYPTNYNKYLNYYKNSFQHGGASMEEVILPFLRLEGK